MSRRRPGPAQPVQPWGRGRLVVVAAGAVLLVVMVIAGLVLSAMSVLGSRPAAAGPSGPVSPSLPESGDARRDAIAAQPMLEVKPDDARKGVPSTRDVPVMALPSANGMGPEDIPSGYAHTPEGAVAQLGAIETKVLSTMSIPVAKKVYGSWAAAGGIGAEDWPMTANVRNFLEASGAGQEKSQAMLVAAVPVAGQVKGTDGADWTVACVLMDIRAQQTTQSRMAYGYCERMQWDAATTRWVIAPGSQAAQAPSTWPDTDLAIKAGWKKTTQEG